MVDFLKHIDYTDEIKRNPELQEHLEKAAKELSETYKNDETYKQPFYDQDVTNFIIVTGLPKVGTDKLSMLNTVLEKVLAKLGVEKVKKITLGTDGSNTNGTGIVEFEDSESATNGAALIQGSKLDKAHTLSTTTIAEYEKVINLSEKYEAPRILLKEELDEWLMDGRKREQVLTRYQGITQLMWVDHFEKELTYVFAKSDGTPIDISQLNDRRINKFVWSRSGSYLAALYQEGIQIFGGKNFDKLNFYEHNGVKNVEFSPDEKYMLSFNGTVIEAPDTENFVVWNVGTTSKLRVFKAEQNEGWGSFSWNFDGSYIARVSPNTLGIYELPLMKLIEDPNNQKRTAIGIENLQKIAWSPSQNVLIAAAYTPKGKHGETNVTQGKLYVIKVPSRDRQNWRTITWEFRDCHLQWDTHGKRIIVVYQKKKSKKTYSTVVQVADYSKTLEITEKEFHDVKSFHLDEGAKRLAIVYFDPATKDNASGTVKYDVEIYKLDDEGKNPLKEVGRLKDKLVSHVAWSNSGAFYALVNTEKGNANNGFLEFGVIKPNNTLEVVKSQKIAYMSKAEWDVSGRCLLVTSETGHFSVWNALGVQLIKNTFNGMQQVLWRPRPKLITEKKEAEINTNIKSYIKRYEEDDDKIINKLKYERERIKKEKRDSFFEYLDKKKKLWESTKEDRVKIFGFDEDALSDLTLDEVLEFEELVDTQIVNA